MMLLENTTVYLFIVFHDATKEHQFNVYLFIILQDATRKHHCLSVYYFPGSHKRTPQLSFYYFTGCYQRTPLFICLCGTDEEQTTNRPRNLYLAKLLVERGVNVNHRVPTVCNYRYIQRSGFIGVVYKNTRTV